MKTQRRFSGQSLVEVAIIFPIVFLLITGFLDLGRAVFYYSSLTNAVREATRYAIVHKAELETAYNNCYNNSLQDKVLEFAFGLTSGANPLLRKDIEACPDPKEGDLFTTVTISATYKFIPVTPGIKEIFGAKTGIPLVAQSTMLVSPGSR